MPVDSQGVQAWDRYAAMNNNPLRYADPTGHMVDDGCTTEGCSYGTKERRTDILRQHNWLKKNVQAGVSTDLEALAQLSDYAADLSGDCVQCFVQDMGATLSGHTGLTAFNELRIQGGHKIDNSPYLEYSSSDYNLNYSSIQGSGELMQSGYAPVYQDPGDGGNQAHHFWFYVQVGFEDGVAMGVTGNLLHETFLSNGAAGRSFQDFALGVVGSSVGQLLSWGAMQPGQVGNYIREVLAIN